MLAWSGRSRFAPAAMRVAAPAVLPLFVATMSAVHPSCGWDASLASISQRSQQRRIHTSVSALAWAPAFSSALTRSTLLLTAAHISAVMSAWFTVTIGWCLNAVITLSTKESAYVRLHVGVGSSSQEPVRNSSTVFCRRHQESCQSLLSVVLREDTLVMYNTSGR
jgi:hypothetical protein